MLASIVFVPVLAAVLVAGIPASSERLAQRVARRSAGGRLSQPMQVVAPNTAVSDASDVDYTANWSGAVVYATTVSAYKYKDDLKVYSLCVRQGCPVAICDRPIHRSHSARAK